MIIGGYAIILAFSTSHALRIEKLLKQQGVDCKPIPVPRQISSDCGVCVRIAQSQIEMARAIVLAAKVEIQDMVAV